MLSHELRTPLNAVLGWTRMLRRGAVPPERTTAILETIERNAAAQMQIVEQRLDLSSMSAGSLRLNVTPVDLRELIGGAVETIRPAADAKTITAKVSIDDSVGEIAGDASRLRQVCGICSATRLEVHGGGWTGDVGPPTVPRTSSSRSRTTGPGIAARFPSNAILEPFRAANRLPRAGWRPRPRFAIVRHVVEAHGGTVTADSDGPGTGRRLVHLRRSSGAHEQGLAPRGLTLRGGRVSSVDDDTSTQEWWRTSCCCTASR